VPVGMILPDVITPPPPELGEDCTDCASRAVIDEEICEDACYFLNDGDCDDGGEGSDYQ
jgi:hypothetical protein